MIKKVILGLGLIAMIQCSEVQNVANQLPNAANLPIGNSTASNQRIGSGLKEALDIGIQQGVQVLGKNNGFYGNELVRVVFPPELQQVEQGLRNIGMGALADKGVKLLNSAAEDAVSTAAPIFSQAIRDMNFNDAKNILLGGSNAATQYLQSSTSSQLENAFRPRVQQSLSKVGADKVWTDMIKQYNLVTGKNIETDLTAYVTERAMDGVFVMVAQKEQDIRSNVASRTTPLLREVFAMQD